jgi:hypothetical protein
MDVEIPQRHALSAQQIERAQDSPACRMQQTEPAGNGPAPTGRPDEHMPALWVHDQHSGDTGDGRRAQEAPCALIEGAHGTMLTHLLSHEDPGTPDINGDECCALHRNGLQDRAGGGIEDAQEQPMREPKLPSIERPKAEREVLEALVRRHSTPQQMAFRARIILACADGLNNAQVARQLDTNINREVQWGADWRRSNYIGGRTTTRKAVA